MEDNVKMNSVIMFAVAFLVLPGTSANLVPSLTVYIWAAAALTLGLAILFLGLDHFASAIVPDRITAFIGWLGVLLTGLMIVLAAVAGVMLELGITFTL